MMTCDVISDRLPALAQGQTDWLPEEEAHLRNCPDCRREWELVQAAAALGAQAADRVDSAAVGDAVLARLQAPQHRSYRVASLVGLAAAAAIVIVAVAGRGPAGIVPNRSTAVPATPAASLLPLPSIAGLDTTALTEVLNSIDDSLPEATGSLGPQLDDLTAQQLEQLLQSLEVS